MAILFASRVMLGKLSFEEVPAKLKDDVKAILEQNNVGYLTGE